MPNYKHDLRNQHCKNCSIGILDVKTYIEHGVPKRKRYILECPRCHAEHSIDERGGTLSLDKKPAK